MQEKQDYSGFVGLKTQDSDFSDFVMQPEEVKKLCVGATFTAEYVYPFIPSDGFNKPVTFTGELVGDDLIFTADIESNRKPKSCAGRIASWLLPAEYKMRDQNRFFSAPGFGKGSVHITTIAAEDHQGHPAKLTKFLLGVENRPGLFLKIGSMHGEFYQDMMFFFPAQATGVMHQSVKFGEAFVLVKQGVELTDIMIHDITSSFNKLIEKSYGDETLYSLRTHESIEEGSLCQLV